ncbi:MAG TPA: hypothetical protein VFZ59_03870 [Verrucomicrobiae bacterium]|nr:hypothetical protein [Verrucomicrobiae bacterium]
MRAFARIVGSLVIFLIFARPAQSQPAEMQITNGPLAGATVRIISKIPCRDIQFAHGQSMVSKDRSNWVLSAKVGNVETNVEARLSAYEYEIMMSKDGTNQTNSFFMFTVQANTEPPLWWVCARPSGDLSPRDFKVFTTQNGNTYASYIDGAFVFYRVRSLRDEASAWQQLWESELKSPDAIPSLEMRMLLGKYGRKLETPYRANYYGSACEDMFETDGELRIKVRGRTTRPKHTFALRNGKWELVSSEGKDPYEEMTPGQIMDDYKKALSEQFEAEVRAKSGQTNNTSGIQTNK